jgi:hypothetical protein
VCKRCKGEGIRTPLGHQAQASMAPLDFLIMKLFAEDCRPGHVTGKPWALNPSPPPSPLPRKFKNCPEIQMEGRGFEPKTSRPFLLPKTHFLKVFNFNF